MTTSAGVSRKIVLSALTLALLSLALLGIFDHIGKEYTDASLKRALVTFGVARGLNGVISVAQGTEVAMEPAGIGVVFAPGQILDPVNDLVERFSWVMLVSSTSLGVQGLLLKIFSSSSFLLLLTVVALAALLLLWWPCLPDVWRKRVYRLTVILLLLRFLIPALAISSEGFFRLFLAAEYSTSSTQLAMTKDTLGRLNEHSRHGNAPAEDLSWYDSLRHDFRATLEAMDIDQYVATLQAAVEDVTEHTINLIVVFTMETILFPLFFLWLALNSIKAAFRSG
jgi:hypothetical protein